MIDAEISASIVYAKVDIRNVASNAANVIIRKIANISAVQAKIRPAIGVK